MSTLRNTLRWLASTDRVEYYTVYDGWMLYPTTYEYGWMDPYYTTEDM